MYELKTKPTDTAVSAFLDNITDEALRSDCYLITQIMERATGEPAKMWGTAIVGCGQYHYKYASGHEGDMCLVGFSPRKANISLYLRVDMGDHETMQKLGKHKTGKGCLYIKKLSDVDQEVLSQLVKASADNMRERYGNA